MTDTDHAFSVVLFSDKHVQSLYLKDKSNGVLFEGLLGPIKEVCFVEDLMLEISGENGVIRIDLDKNHVVKALEGKKRKKSPKPVS